MKIGIHIYNFYQYDIQIVKERGDFNLRISFVLNVKNGPITK